LQHRLDRDAPRVHIAMAGPLTGPSAPIGRSYLQGIRLCLDEVNAAGGVNGRRVTLDIFDDQNRPELAAEMAEAIAADSRVLGVVGHQFSDCSIAAGAVYERAGVPAITPGSTNVSLTRNNDWYFRTVFNDQLQGHFVANYVKKIFSQSRLSIISSEGAYGAYLADTVAREAEALGVTVGRRWNFDPAAPDLDRRLRRIVFDLQLAPDAGAVFLATHAAEGVQIVRLIRDALIRNPLMVPDAFASRAFTEGFDHLPKEKRNPGHYTNGIHITSPLIFDTANERAQRFREVYRERYGADPDWVAAYAFDSALALVEAIRAAGATGDPGAAAEERRRVRDFLAAMTEVEGAVAGVTGFTYFDDNGDAIKPIYLGVFRRRNIISALTQVQPVYNIHRIPRFQEAVRDRRILLFNGRYMYKTNVVYTGVSLNEVSGLDFKDMTCRLDATFWFRYQGAPDVTDIEFLNAVEPVTLGEPLDEQTHDGITSRLYRIRGRFRMDFMRHRHAFGHHFIGFQFRHRGLSKYNLVFVKDLLGMGEPLEAAERLRQTNVLGGAPEWRIHRVRVFPDASERNSLENLRYLELQGEGVKYSRFNYGVLIRKSGFTLRGKVFEGIHETYMVVISLGGLLLLGLAGRGAFFQRFSTSIWGLQSLFALTLLLFAEVVLVAGLSDELPDLYLKGLVRVFDILWWLVPAFLLDMALAPFLWKPMARRTGRPVPDVLRKFLSYVIYFVALYGVIVYVLETDITSLMATSGVIAAIIGFIIKANISNFFSGMVVNQGNALRTGDWIKVAGYDEGRVADITWRSTKLRSRDGALVSIPNSTVSESLIHNFTYPDGVSELSVAVRVDPYHSPDRIRKILLDAAIAADGVMERPGPTVRYKGIEDGAGVYEVGVRISDYGRKGAVLESVWDQIWTSLRVARVALIPGEAEAAETEPGATSPREVLDAIDILIPFSDDAKAELAERVRQRTIPPGQTIVYQGDQGDSLFIVVEGVVGVWMTVEGAPEPLALVRMGAGSFFGEMALLTGEPRSATIISITEVLLCEVTKEDLLPVLEREPEILKRLSEVLAERKLVREVRETQVRERVRRRERKQLSQNLFVRIRRFFGWDD
jgi:branched-chain amino acid transport system substrate-binding protein